MADTLLPPGADRADRRAPQIIADRYEIERELGRGATAIVLLARDQRYDRRVALKVIKPEIATIVGTQRFIHEILIMARLQHPHLLPILDSGETDGLPFYVTPFVDGGSLRSRLDREQQLSMDDAIAITRDVADALTYAHSHGVIHRDIKPDNILMFGGHACVADFGIAQALENAGGDRLTSTGIVLGTPAYMSPEQAAGDRIDARSDVFSLGCVLYEMLAGVRPFSGPTPAAVIAQRFSQAPPRLAAFRPGVSPVIEEAVTRAMAPTPADRQRSAAELAAALGVPLGRPSDWTPPYTPRPRWKIAAVAALTLVAAGAVSWPAVRRRLQSAQPSASRYLVLPVTGSGGRRGLTPQVVHQRLTAALRRWQDLDLVDDATSARVTSLGDVAGAAREIGAGRFVLTALAPAGESLDVHATLYDASRSALRQVVVRLPDDPSSGNDEYRRLATALLRVAEPPPDADEGDAGTDRLGAWYAYARGQQARLRGDLATAERDFRSAVAADNRYGLAHLWLAQVIAWRDPDRRDEWREAAGKAALLSNRLAARDLLLARGLVALGNERYPEACALFGQLRDSLPRSSIPWFGLAACRGHDPVVIRDARSPTGWAFRGSYRAAAAATDSAIARLDAAPDFAFAELERYLLIEPFMIREGRSEGAGAASIAFAAYPSIQHDTLAFVPYPTPVLASGAIAIDRTTRDAALRRDSDELEAQLLAAVRRSPSDPLLLQRFARVQEVRGDRDELHGGKLTALATLNEARRHSSDPAQQRQLALATVRLLVKDNQFAAARAAADSLLGDTLATDAESARLLAGLAALTGKVGRTAELLRAIAADDAAGATGGPRTPPPLAEVGATFTALAALGVCSDSIRELPAHLDQLLARYAPADAQEPLRKQLLAVPLRLAAPCLGPSSTESLGATPDRLVRMEQALGARRIDAVRAQFDTLRRIRTANRPGDIALDHTLLEAWLLAAIGDTSAAISHLDLPLTALATFGTRLLTEVPQAAAIGRAMVFRADLANARGDTATARHWARNVVELWATASPELRSTVDRMRKLADHDPNRG